MGMLVNLHALKQHLGEFLCKSKETSCQSFGPLSEIDPGRPSAPRFVTPDNQAREDSDRSKIHPPSLQWLSSCRAQH